MHLTQKQESLISQYLRDLSRRLDPSQPDKVRERNLRQVQTRIYHDLERLNNRAVSDEDVARVLRQITTSMTEATDPAAPMPLTGAGAPPAPEPIQTPSGSPPAPSLKARAQSPMPVWLGVCAYNAERASVEPWIVRLALVALGLCTGPLAVLIYLVGYTDFYTNLPLKERPPIAWPRLAVRIVVPLAVLIALRWGANKLLDLIAYGHNRIFKEAIPSLGEWDWFRFEEASYFFFALVTVIPLSILSGLPLANAWGHSLKRLAQAIIALYAIAICFGVASVIAGLILDRVQAYTQ